MPSYQREGSPWRPLKLRRPELARRRRSRWSATKPLFCGPVDIAEREARAAQAEQLVRTTLVERGISVVATTFVDNSGITRVKSVPMMRLPHLSAWGVGASTSFDYFRFDDWLAAPPGGTAPVGDLRVIPDMG